VRRIVLALAVIALTSAACAAGAAASRSASSTAVPGSPTAALTEAVASPAGSLAHSPADAPSPDPSLVVSPGPAFDCGRIARDVCERAVAIARAAHEADVSGATTIVVDDDCTSLPKGCAHRQPFDVVVAFIAGHDTTGWYAFEVTGPEPSRPTEAGSLNLGVPDKIMQRLATLTPSVPVDLGPPDPVVDTWPVGPELSCDEAHRCTELTRVGLAGLDARDPGHAPVASTNLHGEGTLVDPQGGRIILNRSGGPFGVLVVVLRDGTTHAIGVGYPGISQTATAIPWEVTLPSGGG
jgi:hypothetical protein